VLCWCDNTAKVTVKRVETLDTIGKKLKKAMAESLEREAPLIIYHPSRLSNAEEFRALFAISSGQAVEHDIRTGKDGYSVQQGMFTDRLQAWNILPVSNLGGLESVLGTSRAVEIVEIAKKRDRSGKPFTMDTVKDNLFVKDLTVEELQALGRAGGEEILALGEFLDLYRQAANSKVRPGKLCIDIKDGDKNLHGSLRLAVNATRAVFEELKARRLEGSAYMIMQYSIDAFRASKKIIGDSAISACVLPRSIINRDGEREFRDYANRAVNVVGADWIVCRIGDLHLIKNLLKSGNNMERGPSMMVYVPPKESSDIKLLIRTLGDYPNIKAVQIDA